MELALQVVRGLGGHVGRGRMGPGQFERGVFDGGHVGFFFPGLFTLLLLIAVVVLLVMVLMNIRKMRGVPISPASTGGRDPAMAEARLRLARGEINEEQYESIKRGLTAGE